MTTVYCGGLGGGHDGSCGVGVARSLRAAFGDLRIIGVADSASCGGVHHPVFDDVCIRPARSDAGAVAGATVQRLEAGAWWIPGSSREACGLAHAAGGHAGLLSPSPDALRRLDTPGDPARRLGLASPASIPTARPDWELGAFGRAHGWRLWLAGPHRERTRIDGWRSLERVRAHLAGNWGAERLRLQAHVEGTRESIVFAAHRGALLGASHLRTALTTDLGATWGGHVADVGVELPELRRALVTELSAAAWTGGGEIEIVRAVDGTAWLIACRPRFPSWVHGVTLAGANLPAALLGAATGRRVPAAPPPGGAFVRVVVEIPLRADLTLPEPEAPVGGVVRAGGYLAGMPDPGRRRSAAGPPAEREAPVDPDGPLREVVADLRRAERTPHAHRIDPARRWARLQAGIRAAAASSGCAIEVAYSIKTDPHAELLTAARAHGWLAEAITAAEYEHARALGYAGDEIVLNGPAKRWPPPTAPVRARAAFADSLEELASLADLTRSGALSARYLGPRVRPPVVASRFGVPLGDFATFSATVAALRELPADQAVGLHVHWASSEAGHATWFETIASTLEWGRCLQELTGRPIACLDLGGGWQPDDFDAVFLPRLGELVTRCRTELAELEVVVLEPGRALVQPLAVVETTVLELRERGGAREIVVDASLAEVPRAGVFAHRMLSRVDGRWRQWRRGPDRVLGRLCMEDDVLSVGVAVPGDVRAGARVLIADAGAYDRSMAYAFGRG